MTARRLSVRIVATLCASLTSSLAVANEHIVDVVWNSQGRFEYSGQVAPGKFIEVCDKLRAGQTIQWQFETAVPADFNIHFHKGKDTVFPAKLSQSRQANEVLKVDTDETHCWMWRNKSESAMALKLSLQR